MVVSWEADFFYVRMRAVALVIDVIVASGLTLMALNSHFCLHEGKQNLSGWCLGWRSVQSVAVCVCAISGSRAAGGCVCAGRVWCGCGSAVCAGCMLACVHAHAFVRAKTSRTQIAVDCCRLPSECCQMSLSNVRSLCFKRD